MFQSVTLEMSLKPFRQTNDAFVESVIENMFLQWRALLKNRKTISILLWVGDGSEILEYGGNPNDEFEWAKYVGTANQPLWEKGDDECLSLHKKCYKYIKDPPRFTYGTLKRIISTVKTVGNRLFPDSLIRVGETFDIGPEFAVSDFKYKNHREISSGMKLDAFGFVDATATLKEDNKKYASCPNGIPDGMPFGTFLGKQCKVFLSDMGFDYIWLSNGLGYSSEPWSKTGKIFDGERFYPEKLKTIKKNVFAFWKLFKDECPDLPIETRGTNNSVGIDYATDGVPLYDIYNANPNVLPPPNSPWAALDDNVGLELMGHMTRICGVPDSGFMFRYYIHDIWWCNSPWYDRYKQSPFDIYLPMALSMIDHAGKVNSARYFAILSIDNSFGNMPDNCANEPLPHILQAEKNAPDEISDFVWVYPFIKYTTTEDVGVLEEEYYGDLFICDEINRSFPLNTVVSVENFVEHDPYLYRGKVLFYPAVESDAVEKLAKFARAGGKVVVYGTAENLNNPEFADFDKVDIRGDVSLLETVRKYGYVIDVNKKSDAAGAPCLTISKHNNARIFSVYNRNLTNEISFRFPLGVPVFTNSDCEIKNGAGIYHFGRGEQKSCRVFVKQENGLVSLYEKAPVSGKYRRMIELKGLENATVYFFPETYCIGNCGFATGDVHKKPIFTDAFTAQNDEHGCYYKAENVSGSIVLMMPFLKHLGENNP